jgi:two-component system, sensor histidine kinase
MQQFSSRIGVLRLVENLTTRVRFAVTRLIPRIVPKRTKEPVKHTRRDREIKLEQRIDAMQQVVDEQALLLRMIVHDLRMPLTGIQGYTDLLRQGAYGAIADEQASALDTIAYSALFLERLINSILDTMSAEAHTLNLKREAFDPRHLAQQVIDDCYPQALRRGLTLQFHCVGYLPRIVGDPDRVRQILFNLVGNAFRYTSEGSVTLTVEALTDMVEFRVADTGAGIAQDLQEIIWKPFMRATDKGDGLGIGLYTVQQLAQAMGGSVGLLSAPGTGSVFWFRLPCQELRKAVGDSGGY